MLPCFHHGACLWPTPFLGRERPIPPSGCLSDGGGRECTPYHAWPWNSALRSCASGNDCRHICALFLSTFTPHAEPLSQLNILVILYAILVTFSSKSKTDLDSYSLRPFEILVPEGSAPVTCRPHRINPILAKEVDATLNQYLVCLLYTSPSPRDRG